MYCYLKILNYLDIKYFAADLVKFFKTIFKFIQSKATIHEVIVLKYLLR